jgi:twinkle protein
MELTLDLLEPYLTIESERSIKAANEYTKDVLDRYILTEHLSGVRLPWGSPDKFRLRKGECTILAGINSSGKSLVAGQILLNAMEQGEKCLSVSLEMSPVAQLVRMWRQASLQLKPSMEFGLGFNFWCKDKLYFFDKMGSVDLTTLMASIRYSLDHFGTSFILVDSLMTISGIANDDYTAQKQVVCDLADACRELDIHVILVCHARKSGSIKDRLDRFSIRGAGELADRVDNVLLLGRYYSDHADEPDAYLSVSKARHWDMGEQEIDLYLDLASLNLVEEHQTPRKINMDDDNWPTGEEDEGSGLEELRAEGS